MLHNQAYEFHVAACLGGVAFRAGLLRHACEFLPLPPQVVRLVAQDSHRQGLHIRMTVQLVAYAPQFQHGLLHNVLSVAVIAKQLSRPFQEPAAYWDNLFY